jgi:Ca-activated chloride channel family protein
MSWGNPWILLALLLPLLAVVGMRRLLRQSPKPLWPAMRRVAVAGERVRAASPKKLRPAFLVMLAIALAIVAIARPRWGEHSEQSFSNTREVLIALDLSRSMLTEDVTPSRLEHAKKITDDLLNNLKGESVGLLVFAGTAFVQVPLSPDYQIVREFMPTLAPDYMPQGGSDYTQMIDAALDGFGETPDRDRYLFVLSDGESSTENWRVRLEELAKRQVHVVSIGLGTDKGAFVPDPHEGGYLGDADGNAVVSKLMPATLQALASRTNGKYVSGASLNDEVDVRDLLKTTVETGQRGRIGNETGTIRAEQFQWFLVPAVLAGLVSLALEFRGRPKPRQVRRAPVAGAALLVVSANLALAPDARAHFDSDAQFEVKEVFESNPTERLRRITEHLAKYDYDAYDLNLLVEEAIKYGIDAKRTGVPPAEGVLRDAIEATQQGERLDKSVANWSYYRSQLTDLLAPAAKNADPEAESQAKKALMDEEDNPPMVTSDGSQQTASDSFGQGASSKTDASLGDLSADKNSPIERRKPTPPGKVRTATSAGGKSGGSDPNDAVLALSRKRLDEVAKHDSPGRVHQLLTGTTQQSDSKQMTW